MHRYACLPVLVHALALLVPAHATACGTALQKADMLAALIRRIPMSDGSTITPDGVIPNTLLQVFENNLNAMGFEIECDAAQCTIRPRSEKQQECANVFVNAMLGNFVNDDFDTDSSLTKIKVDVGTGLLRREYSKDFYRLLFVDLLLILSVIVLLSKNRKVV
jgi:hypothetical protein